MSDEHDPIAWTVFRTPEHGPEEVAGSVTARTWEEAWNAAVAKFGQMVNFVVPASASKERGE